MDDDGGVTPKQQLADERLHGHLRGLVEQLRAQGLGWRPVAATVSERARLSVGYEALRGWAERGGWIVDKPQPDVDDRAAS